MKVYVEPEGGFLTTMDALVDAEKREKERHAEKEEKETERNRLCMHLKSRMMRSRNKEL